MNRKLSSGLLLLYLLSTSIQAEETFHIYAPSRSTQSLLVVKASEVDDKLTLDLTQRIEVGFPAATIVAHPNRPLLYLAPPRGIKDETFGAIVYLDSKEKVARHEEMQLHHGYSYLSLDRSNRYLLGVNYFDGLVDVYGLTPSGQLGKRTAALNEGRRNAHCVLPSPDNKFVYIPYVKDTNALYQYQFDAKSGTLTALEPKNAKPPAGTGPRHMAYHPKYPFVYFSNEQQLGVSVYEKRPSGQLEIRQVCAAVSKDEPTQGVSSSDIVVTRDGRFLFAGIRGHKRDFDWISRYRVKPNGQIELMGLTPADKIPWGLTLSPSGEYLLATAFQDATLTAYRVGDDGSLKRAATLKWDKQISDMVAR